MADINNKPKLQLRSGLSINGDKTPSPATKLLISHGKPNFTIQRSPKIQNGNGNPLSPPPVKPKNEFIVQSTTFSGVLKPSNISVASKQALQQNGNSNGNATDNEASKVVLRRAKVSEPALQEGEDANVPEFIRRQRRIQERLARDNLDFENRRSGYFTQVMISPSSPNRKSFVETMSSPAIVPGLEMPPPVQPEKIEEHEDESKHEENKEELLQEIAQEIVEEPQREDLVAAVPVTLNGQDENEEEEVNKAIEEVNKAVAGEDDEKPLNGETPESSAEELYHAEPTIVAVNTLEAFEETQATEPHVEAAVQVAVTTSALLVEEHIEHNGHVEAVVTSIPIIEEQPQQNGHVEAVVTSAPLPLEQPTEVVETKTNGVAEEIVQNGHSNGEATEHEITILHTNALSTPSIPSPDPSGEKGVNYEPKTVVSFSKDLGSEANNYPDTVKVVTDVESPASASEELKELAKLKFEIKGDEQNIEVTSVLKVE